MSSSSGKPSGLTGRYAKALYELANEKKIVAKIVDDFVKIKSLIKSNNELLGLIKSPAISKNDKQSALIAILKKAKANNLTIQFCGTLAGNGRLFYINEIIDVFLLEVSRQNGEVNAEVISAIELDKSQRQEVEKSISEVVGGNKISLSMKVDESLIGGLIVKIGSKMIDSSIKTKLNRLEIAMRGVN
ncbi:F0F1 ATP synthase subunit delta [Alphaproteobacteria bacterium]|jgi:F-type H+-transporting ATPase subunit delta|nr:F0F1 ATP synthase subunit delta [Alphaproteobacteria bacterium]MDC1209774.1 F0F1 ATP synthase subunit delta [Pseudomonadota bacterium]